MIRDRLHELKAGQDELDADVAVTVEMTADQAAMEQFFTQIERVLEDVAKIEAAVAQVKKKHSEMLSSSQPDEDVTRELDDLMADIKRTGSTVNARLKELAPKNESGVGSGRQTADSRIRQTQHAAATRRFVEAMTQYHHVQAEYRDRCRDRIHRQLKITGKDPTEEELDEMLEKDNLEIFTQGIIMETQQARQQLADIEERHQEILKLEKSIKELHDLFLDVAVLVQSQGEMIDNIASHVTNAEEYVSEAKEQTGQALKYQGKVRRKKIILGVIILVVVIIILLAIFLSI